LQTEIYHFIMKNARRRPVGDGGRAQPTASLDRRRRRTGDHAEPAAIPPDDATHLTTTEAGMSKPNESGAEPLPNVPLGQRLYDNPFLLLVLGIAVMAILFTGWGLWEVLTLPQAELP